MSEKWVSRGFLAAGLANLLGIPLFSMGFTNVYLSELFPEVFSRFGLLMILVWGGAYISVARSYRKVRWLVGVFAVEKLIYSISWVVFLISQGSQLTAIAEKSLLTGVFYATYGPNDMLFCAFFTWVFFRLGHQAPETDVLASTRDNEEAVKVS